MPRPPTQKQLDYLKGLQYTGTPPITSGEAGKLIEDIRGGMSPAKAEKRLLKYREKLRARNIREAKDYLQSLVEMNAQYQTCAGFRVKIYKKDLSPENEIYQNAFLPLEVAIRYTEALLAIPGVDFFDNELQRVPSHGRFMKAPGRVIERKKGARVPTGKTGCGCMVFVAFATVSFLVLTALGFAAVR